MSYIGNTPGVSSQRVVLEEVITGSPKSAFTPVSGYIKGYLDVLVNGVEIDTADYTAADGVTVTLGTAAAVGDTVKIKTWLPRGLSDGYLKTEADARFLNLAGGTLTGTLTVTGNVLMSPNDGSARVVGLSNGTNTTLVLQGGGNGAGALGGNIELGRDGNNMYDATVSRFRSLDGSVTFGQFDANGLGIGGATEAGSLLRLYNGSGNAKITLETADAYAAFINYSGASSEMSSGFVKSDNSFRFCQAGDVSSAERMRLDMNTGNLSPQGNLVLANGKGIDFSAGSNAGGMTGELLSDYEEGSWTPDWRIGGNAAGTWVVKTGRYTKVGNMVTVWAYLYSSTGRGAGTGSVTINNLPFNSVNSALNNYHIMDARGGVIWSGGGAGLPYFYHPANTSYLIAYYTSNGTGATTVQMSEANFSASGALEINVMMSYETT